MRLREIIQEALDLSDRVVIYHHDRLVYHTTNAAAAANILRQGFRTGADLGVNERRKAVYAADKDVNPELYSRNDRDTEPYHGQSTALIPINLKDCVCSTSQMGHIRRAQVTQTRRRSRSTRRSKRSSTEATCTVSHRLPKARSTV